MYSGWELFSVDRMFQGMCQACKGHPGWSFCNIWNANICCWHLPPEDGHQIMSVQKHSNLLKNCARNPRHCKQTICVLLISWIHSSEGLKIRSYSFCAVCEINTCLVANGDKHHHLSTYFSFPSAILGNKASGWLGCAAHGMHDITREPMRPGEELENESEMTLEPFGFVKQSVVTSHSPTTRLDSDTTQTDASSSKNPIVPPSKRRCINNITACICYNFRVAQHYFKFMQVMLLAEIDLHDLIGHSSWVSESW